MFSDPKPLKVSGVQSFFLVKHFEIPSISICTKRPRIERLSTNEEFKKPDVIWLKSAWTFPLLKELSVNEDVFCRILQNHKEAKKNPGFRIVLESIEHDYKDLKVLRLPANRELAVACRTLKSEARGPFPSRGNILLLDVFVVFSWFCRIYRMHLSLGKTLLILHPRLY